MSTSTVHAGSLPRHAGSGENRSRAVPLVAVVDDTDANRYALLRTIRSAGYEVVSGSRGQHAFELARAHDLDLLVLDVKMPDISGWDVCARMKRDPATAAIPILQISASYTADHDRVHGLDNGADGYLVQPVDPHVLLATVRALLRMKFAHDAALRSESSLRSVLDSAPVILFAVDANGIYTLFTGRALGRLKHAAPSVVGQSLFELHAGDARFVANAVRALRGESFVDELPLYGRSFEIRYNPVEHGGGHTHGFMAVATDITERKKAEQARENLLAVVAHDLRTPLSGIVLGVRLLKHALSDRNPKLAADAALAGIDRSAKTAERLIADLLDHARIEAGRLKINAVAQELEPLLREAIELMLPLAREKNIDIALRAPEPASAAYDRSPLLRAVCNLLGNALKFSPQASEVTVSTSVESDRVVVAVRDQGPGIPEEELPHLFERFWQGGRKQELGVGLGLSIAAGIVTAHGGRTWAENNAAGGATFYLSLPKTSPGRHDA